MKFTLAILSAVLTCTNAIKIEQNNSSVEEKFSKWAAKFNRSYKNSSERSKRMRNF